MYPPVTSLALVATLVLGACGGGGSSSSTRAAATTTPTPAPNCRPVPPKTAIANPDWVPADLPLPDGTYLFRDAGAANGVHQGVFTVPGGVKDFVRFALTQWPPKGWHLGRGDSESNEAEDDFSKAAAAGSFKVRSDYCDLTWSELTLSYKPGTT